MLRQKARKRLIVHLGYHKTGSSSIQEWLREHKPVLDEQMACYNLMDETSNGIKFAANAFAMGFMTPEAFLAAATEWADTFEAQPQPLVVLTDEALPGIPLGAETRGYLETEIYPMAADVVEILAQAFARFDTTFVLYEREPQAWLKSMHNQMVRGSFFKGSFQDYLDTFQPQVDWPALRASLAEAIHRGNPDAALVACAFEEEFAKSNVRDMRLFQLLDLPEETMAQCSPTLKVINKSVSDEQLEIWKARTRITRILTVDELKLLYLVVLGREPGEAELKHILAKGTGLEDIRQMLLTSREFAKYQASLRLA